MPKVPAVATTDIGTALALVARVQHFNKPKQKFIRFRYKHKTNPVQADIVVRVGMKTAWMVDPTDQGYQDFAKLSWEEKDEKKRPDGGWPIKRRRRYLDAEKVSVSIGEVDVKDDGDLLNWAGGRNYTCRFDLSECCVEGGIRPFGERLWYALTAPPKEATIQQFHKQSFYSSTTCRVWLGNHNGTVIIDATVILDPKTHRVVAHIPLIDDWETDIAYINYE